MAYSTAYSNNLYDSKPLNYQTSYEWIDNIAKKRSQLDEQVYQYVDGLKNKALNIKFLNQTAQKVTDGYNTEIDEFFKNNDLSKVDLADYKTANQYTKIFDKITTDKNLLGAYQVDKQVKSAWEEWKTAAKNPNKTGYNKSNYNVWLNENLMPYMQEGNMTKLPTYNPGIYDPEYDYHKELKAIGGDLHFDGKKWEMKKGDGSKEVVDAQYLTAEKIMTFFKGVMTSKATAQMLTEAKSGFYDMYNNTPDASKNKLALDLYSDDKSKYDSIRATYLTKIEEFKGKKSAASPKEQENYDKAINQMQEEADEFKFTRSEKDYTGLSKFGLANHYAQSSVMDRLKNRANGMAYKVEKVTEATDDNYWKINDFKFDVNKEQYNRDRNLVKDNQWKAEYDLKVQGLEQKVEKNNATLALKATDPELIKQSKGYFSGYTVGEVESGVMTWDSLDIKLNEFNTMLKNSNPENLTKESIQALVNTKDDTPLGKIVRTYFLQQGGNTVTDNIVGVIKQQVKNELEHGNLSEYYTDLKNEQSLYSNMKQKAWTQVIHDYVPELVGKAYPEVRKYFDTHPSLASAVKENLNSRITTEMQSIRGNNVIFELGDKDVKDRNKNLITSAVNSVMKDNAVTPEMKAKTITPEMIAYAEYSPLTGKMNVVLKPITGDGIRLEPETITVQTPQVIRNQFGIDINHKAKLAETQNFLLGDYKGGNYKISKDFLSGGWHVAIKFKNGEEMNTAGTYMDGEYKSSPIQGDINSIEANVKNIIETKNRNIKN